MFTRVLRCVADNTTPRCDACFVAAHTQIVSDIIKNYSIQNPSELLLNGTVRPPRWEQVPSVLSSLRNMVRGEGAEAIPDVHRHC